MYGRATMTGKKRVVGSDYSHETLVQSATHVIEPEEQPQAVSAGNNTQVGIERDTFPEEIVVQCPPVSESRIPPQMQRTGSLPPRQPKDVPSNPVQRSRTAPNLGSRPTPSTPKKTVRGEKPQASRVNRSRVISVSTDSCTTDDESVPSSPATNVSSTLSPVCSRRLRSSSPRERKPCHSSAVRSGDLGDGDQRRPRCCRSDGREDKHSHRTLTARPIWGGKDPVRTASISPSKKVAETPGSPVQSPARRGVSNYHRPTRGVARGPSSSTNWPPSINEGTLGLPAHDRGSRPHPSPGESSRLTYASDDECAAVVSTHLTGDSEYYTPSSRNSEVSDIESEPSTRRKGKRRASPPPLSSPPLSIDSSPRDPDSVPGSSRKKRRSRRSRPPGSGSGVNHWEQTQPQGIGQSLGQDVCHCTGPCPSCYKPRTFSQFHPFMFPPGYYPYSYFPQPHMPSGYHPTHYGPLPYSYPYAIPQQTEPIPSISSSQPPPPPSGYFMPPTLPIFPSNANPDPPIHVPPVPAPPSSTPAPTPSVSTTASSPSPIVNSPPVEPPTSQQVPPELLGALDRFYQPPQRSVKVIDPSYDPRSPYSKKSIVPAFPNR